MRFSGGRHRGYQCNWLTIKIGSKWWGLSKFRLYDPEIGRFLGRDLMPNLVKVTNSTLGWTFFKVVRKYEGRLNLYLFASGYPSGRVDPNGLAECDCKPDDCKGLDDLKAKINEWINKTIQDAKDDHGAAVKREFGGSPISAIETRIGGLGDKFRKSKKQADTKYANIGALAGGVAWAVRDVAVSPCILLCGVCIGSDKVGHFIDDGYAWFKASTEGTTDKNTGGRVRATPELADFQSYSNERFLGPGTTSGSAGEAATGVISWADMAANRAGGQFYTDLKTLGKTLIFDICTYVAKEKGIGMKIPPEAEKDAGRAIGGTGSWSEEDNPNNDYSDPVKKGLK